MARPQKKGMEYFSFDVGFFDDRKIKELKGKFGSDGITVYIYLLCLIYKENGYYIQLDEGFNYVASADLLMDSEKIGQIINFLCKRSLFDDTLFTSDKVLTSHGIQLRFQEVVKSRKKEIDVINKFWILSKDETQSYIKCADFQSFSKKNLGFSENNPSFSENNPHKEKKSKVNKNKENNSMPGADYSAPVQKPVMKLPLNDNTEHCITKEDIEHWRELYPAVNIMQELRNMTGWLEANPAKRKTKNGIRRFIANWLAKEQNKGGMSYGTNRRNNGDDYAGTVWGG